MWGRSVSKAVANCLTCRPGGLGPEPVWPSDAPTCSLNAPDHFWMAVGSWHVFHEAGWPRILSDSIRSTAIPLVVLSLVEWCGVWINDVTNPSGRTRWNLLSPWVLALLDPTVACWTLLCIFAWRTMYVSVWLWPEAIWPNLEAGRPGLGRTAWSCGQMAPTFSSMPSWSDIFVFFLRFIHLSSCNKYMPQNSWNHVSSKSSVDLCQMCSVFPSFQRILMVEMVVYRPSTRPQA